jgi:hypothetical protein
MYGVCAQRLAVWKALRAIAEGDMPLLVNAL